MPVNMNRSYKYSLFFVGTVCKMFFTSVYPDSKDQEYGSTEKFKRTGMLLHKKTAHHKMGSLSDSDRIQTCNLLIRSQMLYSVELRSRYAAKLVVLCCDLLLLDACLLT